MLLRPGALCGRGQADDEGAMPLPRVPIYHRRRAQHVCADADRRLQLYRGGAKIAPRWCGNKLANAWLASMVNRVLTSPYLWWSDPFPAGLIVRSAAPTGLALYVWQ